MITTKNSKKKIIIVACICVLITLLVAAFFIYQDYKRQIAEDIAGDSETIAALDTPEGDDAKMKKLSDKPFYTLILGSDQRPGDDEPSRSDVMILARVDLKENTVSLMSFPRDLMVELDEYGTQKINAAYAFEGTKGAVNIVKELTGLPIQHYMEIHFEELEEAVDSLGGLDVNVPVANDETGGTSIDIIEEGWHHFSGEEALTFARERYGYARGDFQRGDNQRLLIMAFADKLRSLPPAELPSTMLQLAKCVSTDLSVDEMITLAKALSSSEELTMYSTVVPCNSEMVDGVSYDIIDEEAFEEMLTLLDSGKDPSTAESGDSGNSTATGNKFASRNTSNSNSSTNTSTRNQTNLSNNTASNSSNKER